MTLNPSDAKNPSDASDNIRRVAIIVAAGSGERAAMGVPKQFADYDGKPLLLHSVEAFAAWPLCDEIILVVAHDQLQRASALIANADRVTYVIGGDSRRESVWHGLQAVQRDTANTRVFIHDAARPSVPLAVLERLDHALSLAAGAIPALPVVDTLCEGADEVMVGTVDRQNLWRVQTPQAFDFAKILAAHQIWPKHQDATDDAGMLRYAGGTVKIILGDEKLHKITFADDFDVSDTKPEPDVHEPSVRTAITPMADDNMVSRIGMGYDVHRLAAGEDLWLCGVKLEHERGLCGHSDADVALHALTDALLGAMALGDIGDHFPPCDPQWRGARSDQFLRHARDVVTASGGHIINVDLTLICEAPKIGPHRLAMRQSVADILQLPLNAVSIKATTTERLGFAGREEGIAAQAIASIAAPAVIKDDI